MIITSQHIWIYLRQVRYRLDAKALEDKAKSLNGHGVVLRERLVLEYPHQRVDGNGGIEVFQARPASHGHQKLTGRVTAPCTSITHTHKTRVST